MNQRASSGSFSWSAMDYFGGAGIGTPRLIKQESGNVTSGDLWAHQGQICFLALSWPIYTSYTGELDLIGNKKVNSYCLGVVWKKAKCRCWCILLYRKDIKKRTSTTIFLTR